MRWPKRNKNGTRLSRQLALGLLADAMAEQDAPCAGPVRLEDGTPLEAVTDAGDLVTGNVARVWQTFADARTGAFRVLVVPAGEDDGGQAAAS